MRIKIIQLNTWHGGELFPEVIDFLKKEGPDIVTCQEVYNSTNQNLPKRFRTIQEFMKSLDFKDYTYSPCMNQILPEGEVLWGNAIFSKFPISNKNTLFYYRELKDIKAEGPNDFRELPRNLSYAKIKINNHELNVFNNHGFWDFKGEDTERRLMMADYIVKQIKEKENVILAGDFNVNEGTESIGRIEKVLKNIFKGERKTSFNMKQKTDPGFASAVVDFIFVSPQIKVIEHKQLDINISDHLPLVAILEID